MTDAARMITCPACGGCIVKIGRVSDEPPRSLPCPMCGHGLVDSAPIDETVAIHRFGAGGIYEGLMNAPGDDSNWKDEYGYPPPSEIFKNKRPTW